MYQLKNFNTENKTNCFGENYTILSSDLIKIVIYSDMAKAYDINNNYQIIDFADSLPKLLEKIRI